MMNSTFDVRDVLDEIAIDTPPASAGLADTALRRSRRRRYAARGATAAGLATAASVVVIAVAPDRTPETSVPPAGPPEAPAQDDRSAQQDEAPVEPDSSSETLDTGGLPLLLIDDPAWEVSYASEVPSASGEVEMADGERHLQINWFPADRFDDRVDDRRRSSNLEERVTVLGREAVFFRYAGDRLDLTTLWRQGEVTLEARGQGFADRASYQAVLDQLVEVDGDAWLAALPDDAVAPDERADGVAEMLADIPTPAGIDSSEIAGTAPVESRYHLGVDVTTAVLCGWTKEWMAAEESGDDDAADAAVAAITSAREWAILQEMDEQGGYAENIWSIVDHIASGGTNDELEMQSMGTDMSVEPPDPDEPLDKYRNAFGCAK